MVRLYLQDGSNVDLCRRSIVENGGRIFIVGSSGADLVDGLLPNKDAKLDTDQLLSGKLQQVGKMEWIVYKPRWGAFYKTPLEKHLNAMDVSTIIFIGCNYPNCPRTSIYEASERDFRIIVIKDALSQFSEQAQKELNNIGVVVLDKKEFLNQCGPTTRCT